MRSSAISRAVVQAMIDAGGAAVALTPGVVPDLLTVGLPVLGSWWTNQPSYGGTTMTPYGCSYTTSVFGAEAFAADPIGVKCTSVIGAYSGAGWFGNTQPETTVARRPWIRGRLKVSSSRDEQTVQFGWADGLVGAGHVSVNSVTLYCDTVTAAGGGFEQANWQLATRGAGSHTMIDLAVPYSASHDYELFVSVAGTTVVWAIYDHTTSTAYGGTQTPANLPASTSGLGFTVAGATGPSVLGQLELTWGPFPRGQFGPA